MRFRAQLVNHEAPVRFRIVALVGHDRHDRGAVLDRLLQRRPQMLEIRSGTQRRYDRQYRHRSRVDDERELDVLPNRSQLRSF